CNGHRCTQLYTSRHLTTARWSRLLIYRPGGPQSPAPVRSAPTEEVGAAHTEELPQLIPKRSTVEVELMCSVRSTTPATPHLSRTATTLKPTYPHSGL